MRSDTEQTMQGAILRRITLPCARWVAVLAVLVLAACALGYAARGYTRRSSEPFSSRPSRSKALSQRDQPVAGSLISRLRLQPEADKLCRRLGQRFSKANLGVSVFMGTITIGTRRDAIRITRAHDGDGERVAIEIGNEAATLTWQAFEGTRASGGDAGSATRSIVERLVLDSPDQFIFAQLRGAAYHKMAQNVRPVEAGDSDDYEGPVWDMVRVVESTSRSNNKPISDSRIYYINSSTGLIDKILSQEGSEDVIAAVSSWVEQDGEVLPTGVTWTKDKQVLMELRISNVLFGSR
jgi:hypothetical protein